MTLPPSSPNPARSSKLRQWLYLGLGTFVTVVLLSWVLRGASLSLVWQILQQAKPQWIAVSWLAYLAVFWIRAWRWGTLLSARHAPGRFQSRLHASLIGFGASSVLPGHAGEFIRSALLYRFDRVPVEASLGTILVERLLDIGMVFLLLLSALAWTEQSMPLHFGKFGLIWIGAAIVLLWLLLLISASFPAQIALWCGRISQAVGLGKFRGRITQGMSGLLSGLDALRQPRCAMLALFQTLCSWGLNSITYWAGLKALNIDAPGIWGAIFTQSATAFTIALPSSPGYIGPFEAGIHYALSLYQVSTEQSIACALLLRFLMYITIPIIAAFLMLYLGLTQSDLSPKKVSQKAAEDDNAVSAASALYRPNSKLQDPR